MALRKKQPIPPLYAHQKATIRLLKKQERVFDTSDPGTGKTRAALEAWAYRRRKGGGCLLVIAPKSLLQPAWGNEIDLFIPKFSYSIAYASNREKAFEADADIYITNTDAVKWLDKQPKKFFKRFDSIIVDESSNFKHRTSQRSKALIKISDYFKFRQALTGTPNSNTITDIWNQLKFLDGGSRLGKSFFYFRGAVCAPVQTGPMPNMLKWEDKAGSQEAVNDLIKDITIRHQFDECMDIPPNVERHVSFKMQPKHYCKYLQMQEEALVILEDGHISAINAAVLRTKLLQIASGAVYKEDGSYSIIDKGRYELILDLVEARKHSIVFFNWKHQRDQLVEEAKKRGIMFAVIDSNTKDYERTNIVNAYQAGFYKTIFLHPKTGAHGLTLTRGTATIWSSPIYEADFLKQGKHRIWRGGQTLKTETIMVEAEGTVERQVFDRLNIKTNRMVSFLDLIKHNPGGSYTAE